MKILAAALVITLTALSTAFAQEEHPACMAPLPVTADLVRDAGFYDLSGFAGEGAAPAFVLGTLSPTRDAEDAQDVHGAVLFARDVSGDVSGTWRAWQVQPGEGVAAVFVAPASGDVMFITMWDSEGPGQWWTLVRTNAAFEKLTCTMVRFPSALNQPSWANEFLSVEDFDIRANGRGELIGSAQVERDGAQKVWWYRYRTSDNAATWGNPARTSAGRAAPAGPFTKVDEEAEPPAELLADLRRFAEGR